MLRSTTLVLVAAGLCCIQAGYGAEPWDTAFSKDQAQLLAASKSATVPEGADVVILLNDLRYSIDSAGRTTTTLRKLYRVITSDAVDEWSALEQEYEPWHERKPELRARVISADGAAHWLDSRTMTDAPAREFDASVYSDRRVLRAPLPAVAPGSVVEYEVVTHETAPLFEAGSVRRISLSPGIQTQRLHILVEAAPGVTLRSRAQLIPPESVHRTETRSGIRIECDWGPIAPVKEWESSAPFDVVQQPVFEFATGSSWQAVASHYAAVVDSRIGSANLAAFAPPPAQGEAPSATIARLVAALHKQVRYTGLELGDAAIVPAPPAEVLTRQYGDCKDKATLLVAALRAAGMKASVALLATGFGLDTSADLPGLGQFDHAIVYVETPEPLWIDATAQYTRVGTLPPADQGRLALIANSGTTTLVKTPESRSSDNRSIHTVEIRLPDFGRSEIRETVESFGSEESVVRARFGADQPVKAREALERQVKPIYLTEALTDFSTSRADDFSRPFQVTVSVRNAGRASTEEDGANAGLFTHFLFSGLPYGIIHAPSEPGDAQEKKPRIHDFVISEPYQQEYRYRIYFPSFLKPKPLPKDRQLQLGPATYAATYRLDPQGFVEAVYRFDSVKRRFTSAEFAELRTGVRRVWSEKPEILGFTSATSEALALGKSAEAVRISRDYLTAKPLSAPAQARFSRVLIAVGAGDAALAAAKRAVELDPKSTQAWQALAWAYQHDSFGRRFSGNWNVSEAEKAQRQAIAVAADDLVPQTDLAILQEHSPDGVRYADSAHLKDAIDTYRGALKKSPNTFIQQNLVIALLYAGRYEEVAAELNTLSAGPLKPILSLIAAGLTSGAERAILDSQSDNPDPSARYAALVNAGITMVQMRKYELATEFFQAARRITAKSDLETRLASVSRMKRFDQLQFPPDDPRSVVRRFYLEAFSGHVDEAHLRPLMSKRETFTSTPGDDSMEKSIRRLMAATKRRFQSLGITGDGMLDLIMSHLELTSKGDDSLGYRISGKGVSIPPAYVVKEDGEYRLLATADRLENVGKLLLELVQANQLAPARMWLDLVVNGTYLPPGKTNTTGSFSPMDAGPLGEDSPAVRLIWDGLTENGKTATVIRIAAASLVGTFSASPAAILILKSERHAAANAVDRGNIDLALCQAYARAAKWPELLAAAKDLKTSYAVKDKSFGFVVKARTGLKQWAELEQDARAELKPPAPNPAALMAAAVAGMRAGKLEKANEFIQQIRALQFSTKDEHALVAWHALLTGNSDDKLIENLEKDRGNDNPSPDRYYLLGFLQAQNGKTDDARRSLATALDMEDFTQLDARPWVLQGKLQTQLGNSGAAAAAYAEARKHTDGSDNSEWALRLLPAAVKQ